MTDPDTAIVDLQTRLEFQDDTIARLDEVVRQQYVLIDALANRVDALEARVKETPADPETSDPANEKPPHY